MVNPPRQGFSPRRFALALLLVVAVPALAADGDRNARGGSGSGGGDGDPRATFLATVPAVPGNVILARPTAHGVTASVWLRQPARVRIEYGAAGQPERRTAGVELAAGEPRDILLDQLPANAACHYRLVEDATGRALLPAAGSGTFHTARPPGSSFTFTLTADAHLDGFCRPELYTQTLATALAQKPDFHLDLGDTFMTGKIPDRAAARQQYDAQRYYFGLLAHAAPLFLVLGNHDGEEAAKPGATAAGGLAVWACQQRQRFFPNPRPDAFYGGNRDSQPLVGALQDYYAWEWGDALFVVLDPYWYSRANRGGAHPWNSTLGKAQYDWLAQTLRGSRAAYKFVFIHQLVGGLGQGGRGGAEAVPFYEWGGRGADGRDAFAANRPGWEQPIHPLLVETGVRAVFHGHDHFYARQEVDGIVYQLVPQACNRNTQNHQATEYGYLTGEFLPNSGALRVTVTPAAATVAYLRSTEPAPARPDGAAAPPAAVYTLRPRPSSAP